MEVFDIAQSVLTCVREGHQLATSSNFDPERYLVPVCSPTHGGTTFRFVVGEPRKLLTCTLGTNCYCGAKYVREIVPNDDYSSIRHDLVQDTGREPLYQDLAIYENSKRQPQTSGNQDCRWDCPVCKRYRKCCFEKDGVTRRPKPKYKLKRLYKVCHCCFLPICGKMRLGEYVKCQRCRVHFLPYALIATKSLEEVTIDRRGRPLGIRLMPDPFLAGICIIAKIDVNSPFAQQYGLQVGTRIRQIGRRVKSRDGVVMPEHAKASTEADLVRDETCIDLDDSNWYKLAIAGGGSGGCREIISFVVEKYNVVATIEKESPTQKLGIGIKQVAPQRFQVSSLTTRSPFREKGLGVGMNVVQVMATHLRNQVDLTSAMTKIRELKGGKVTIVAEFY